MAKNEETKEKLEEVVEGDNKDTKDEKTPDAPETFTAEQLEAARKKAVEDFKADEKKKADKKSADDKRKKAEEEGDKDTIIADLQTQVTELSGVNDRLAVATDLLQRFFDAQTKDLSKVLVSAIKNLPIEQKFEWLLENQDELNKKEEKDDKPTTKIPNLPNRETTTKTADKEKLEKGRQAQAMHIKNNF